MHFGEAKEQAEVQEQPGEQDWHEFHGSDFPVFDLGEREE